jgi:hypothetical protein
MSDMVNKAWIDVARDVGKQDREFEVQQLKAEIERLRVKVRAWEMIAVGAVRERDQFASEIKQLKAQLEYRSLHPNMDKVEGEI